MKGPYKNNSQNYFTNNNLNYQKAINIKRIQIVTKFLSETPLSRLMSYQPPFPFILLSYLKNKGKKDLSNSSIKNQTEEYSEQNSQTHL